jgi:hypothetical protein
MPGAIQLDPMAAASLGTAWVSIWLSRRPRRATLPPEMSIEGLPAEIQERIFLAEDTPQTEDDIAALESGIAFVEQRLTREDTADDRVPLRRQLRELRGHIARLRDGPTPVLGLSSLFDPVWSFLYKLPPLGRRTRPWLAAVIGFAFGGIGLVFYFRKLADILVLATFVIAAGAIGAVVDFGGWWWVLAGVASFYGFLRAESSNRRLVWQDLPGSARALEPEAMQGAHHD